MSAFELSVAEQAEGRILRAAGRPADAAQWARACHELRLGLAGAGRVLLTIEAGPETWAPLPRRRPGAAVGLVEAAEALLHARSRLAGALGVRASGRLAGPLLVLALSADLLVAEEGMAGEALFWEDSRLLVPGELSALGDRLGRARTLEHALAGGTLRPDELGALDGEDADRAWEAFLRGSRTAQAAASRLGRVRGAGRRGAEALERAFFALCFAEPDRSEGVRAFRERREPDFPSNRTETRSRGTE